MSDVVWPYEFDGWFSECETLLADEEASSEGTAAHPGNASPKRRPKRARLSGSSGEPDVHEEDVAGNVSNGTPRRIPVNLHAGAEDVAMHEADDDQEPKNSADAKGKGKMVTELPAKRRKQLLVLPRCPDTGVVRTVRNVCRTSTSVTRRFWCLNCKMQAGNQRWQVKLDDVVHCELQLQDYLSKMDVQEHRVERNPAEPQMDVKAYLDEERRLADHPRSVAQWLEVDVPEANAMATH
ncbi:hypothetical protein CYMTET_41692 [Cymbomonas tetramitiformis]|uniref:Uncharacterized protein n=1 Tax=Cymbomonas tetramitiformis TaxID=36881 RepID=A0AAE0C7A2_9CHLO|nr:hypothetical protein CYMTET_41692 [Cymbomonas tetramitiformis]